MKKHKVIGRANTLNRLIKGFKNEGEFERFLLKNKDYVLGLMVKEKMWDKQKYICDSTMLICSVRYAIGRKTGIVSRVVEWIIDEWDQMENEVKTDIIHEILRFEQQHGDLGREYDREMWYKIVNKQTYGFNNEMIETN